MAIAAQTLYLNADKSKTVKEGSPDAAFLLCREGCAVSDEDVEKYGVKVRKEGETEEDPNIIISGGAASGQAVVTGEPIEDEAKDSKKARKGK